MNFNCDLVKQSFFEVQLCCPKDCSDANIEFAADFLTGHKNHAWIIRREYPTYCQCADHEDRHHVMLSYVGEGI